MNLEILMVYFVTGYNYYVIYVKIILDKGYPFEYTNIRNGVTNREGKGCKKPFNQLRGFGEKKLNKITLSMDKEWKGFFVLRRKGVNTCEK
jgi:hypothetical protein